MSYEFKDIDIKKYSFDDMIKVKRFDPKKIKIDVKSCKYILIFYIR